MNAVKTAAEPAAVSSGYSIGCYLRISQEDDLKDESASITHQRALVRGYIASLAEFNGAKLIEYVDDGVSGSLTNRDAYQRLMRDADNGDIQCVITKDLSRIGRDMIEADDLLMNRLVTLGVRFIAIGEGYDSLRHPLSTLELAVINLANQHYNRDLAMKSMSARLMKLKRGEHLAIPPFGFKKSREKKGRLVIDEGTAGYVRLIFSLAIEGKNFTQIAYILNAQGAPTPSVYKCENGIGGNRWENGRRCAFWTSAAVGNIFHNPCYTGTAAGHRTTTVSMGEKHTYRRAESDWIVVPDAHEVIVSKADYDRAHAVFNRKRRSDAPVDHIFQGMIKCPVCGRTMKRINPMNPAFMCYTRYYTDAYACPKVTVPQSRLEGLILPTVKAYAATLIERGEARLEIAKHGKARKAEIENRIKAEEHAVKLLTDSITKNFTAFVAGSLTQDDFLNKKAAINDTIARKRAEIERLQGELAAIDAGEETIGERLAELRSILTLDRLDKEIIDLLIDKILIHDEQDIEVVWSGPLVE